jgi:flagellar basal-body rod protein FlgG
MNRALSIAASGMQAQELRTSTIANNMANVNTTAFKKSTAQFEDMLYEKIVAPGADTSSGTIPAGQQLGTGVRMSSVSKIFKQGALQTSSGDLDLAIEGTGFFQVQLSDGTTAYTRDGHFHLDEAGSVVSNSGDPVIGFPTLDPKASSITITSDGTVTQFVNGTTTTAGRLQIARIPNPEGLSYEGRNLYKETPASGSAQTGNPGTSDMGNIAQHYLEGSNVEIVKEMVDMIAAQRAYELNSKSIKTADEMMRQVANLK